MAYPSIPLISVNDILLEIVTSILQPMLKVSLGLVAGCFLRISKHKLLRLFSLLNTDYAIIAKGKYGPDLGFSISGFCVPPLNSLTTGVALS